MSNRFVSSFPPSIAGSPLQAEGSPAVPAVPGTDPTPSPRRPASPVALYGVGAHPAGCRRSPRPKFAELAQVSRGRAACPHHPRRLPHAAGTPQPAPQRRAGSPHPSIHSSIHPGRSPTCCKEPQQQQQHAQQQQRVQQQQQLLSLCRAILCPWRGPPRPARPRSSRGRWKALVASWQGSLPSQKGPAVAPHRPAG